MIRYVQLDDGLIETADDRDGLIDETVADVAVIVCGSDEPGWRGGVHSVLAVDGATGVRRPGRLTETPVQCSTWNNR